MPERLVKIAVTIDNFGNAGASAVLDADTQEQGWTNQKCAIQRSQTICRDAVKLYGQENEPGRHEDSYIVEARLQDPHKRIHLAGSSEPLPKDEPCRS